MSETTLLDMSDDDVQQSEQTSDDAASTEPETPKSKRSKTKAEPEILETEVASEPPCALPAALQPGDSSPAVTVLQNALAAASLLQGRERGTYDLATQVAVQRAQRRARAHGYNGPIHGVWDDSTRRAVCRLLQ